MRHIRGTKCTEGDKFELNIPVEEMEAGCLIHYLPFESKVTTFLTIESTLYWCRQCDKQSMGETTIVCRGESESYRKVVKEMKGR